MMTNMEFQYSYQDTVHTIDLKQVDKHRFKATIGERELDFSAVRQSVGIWLLIFDNRRILAYIARDGDMRYVHVQGNSVTLTAYDERANRRKQSGSAGDLTAQMPGQVVEVLVNEGEAVSSGQTLVILEAMKMEIRVTAPSDGTVKGVHVAQGDIVQRGQPLIELE